MLTLTQLQRARRRPLPTRRALVRYHDELLLLRAYPPDADTGALVDAELARIASHLKRQRAIREALRDADGLPFVETASTYSHDCVRWLLSHPHCRVSIDGFADGTLKLVDVLRLTLPRLERTETNADHTNDELLDVLRVPASKRLEFLVAELSRLDASPLVKDQLFDALGLQLRVTPTDAAFSTAFNRLSMPALFCDSELVKRFDAMALMDSPLPHSRALGEAERDDVIRVIRNTMALHTRETDPATYLDARSLRVFDLERGVSIAIFTMTHDRQLAMESYVGFTAFKNGLPVSYGGSWVLGARADFGMNIFAPYRGGESGYIMCQLLRVYRQQFGVRYFEVDAHQFGLDNEEGIETGAFWFYWRYGFRPVDSTLRAFATREKARLAKTPGARSTRATLLKLTGSNVALNFGGRIPRSLDETTARVTRMIAREYGSNRVAAEHDCIVRFLRAAEMTMPRESDTRDALAEIALFARAYAVTQHNTVQRLAELVLIKPVNVYRYQSLLGEILAGL